MSGKALHANRNLFRFSGLICDFTCMLSWITSAFSRSLLSLNLVNNPNEDKESINYSYCLLLYKFAKELKNIFQLNAFRSERCLAGICGIMNCFPRSPSTQSCPALFDHRGNQILCFSSWCDLICKKMCITLIIVKMYIIVYSRWSEIIKLMNNHQ